jgi:hypothetical protein
LEIHTYRFRCKSNDEFLVIPIGDIQYAGRGSSTALSMLQRTIEWGVEHDAWFLGMGDYIDFASPSNRQRLREAALYDTAENVIENAAEDLTNEIYEKALKPSKGRWLGLLEGHHFYQFQHGTTSDQHLCKMLETKFLGTSAYVRMEFHCGPSNKSTSRGNVLIWCSHGTGSGRIGAPLNKLELLPTYFDGDIYLMGHQSKKVMAPLPHVTPIFRGNGGPKLQERTIIIAGTGGFSAGYMLNSKMGQVPRGSYVEQKMLMPVALGNIVVKIRPRWTHESQRWQPQLSVEA